MPQESPDRKEGATHTTGAGSTPARHVVRSGDVDVPGETHDIENTKGDGTDTPAMVGTSGTGEADLTPGEDE